MIKAVVFDMDGLLIDSEPLWHEAEIRALGEVGVPLDARMCLETTGLRSDEAVDYWYRRYPWPGPSKEEVERRMNNGFIELVSRQGGPKPGVDHAISFVGSCGAKVALASSSPYTIIERIVEKLGLANAFEVIYSAQEEEYGKPHPGIYITTARKLGVPAEECLAIEDSLNGVLAAKAAKMKCVAIPEGPALTDRRFAIADAVLGSLDEIDGEVWNRLNSG